MRGVGGTDVVHVLESPGGGLQATVTTRRLHLRSTVRDDAATLCALYADEQVMRLFMDGRPLPAERTAGRVDAWARRWEAGDPFSSFSVFRRDDARLVGLAVLGRGGRPGCAELAGLGWPDQWGQGLGREAARALVHAWAPEAQRRGALVDGSRLGTIVGTARPDNPASRALMAGVGMQCVGQQVKWGVPREHFALELPPPPPRAGAGGRASGSARPRAATAHPGTARRGPGPAAADATD